MIFGFSRNLRLLKASEFKRVFDKAEIKVSDKNLLILARRNTLGIPRLGLVIAKKNIRTAVARNKVKRIIRETFRLSQNSLPELDYVVLARKGLGELDNRQLHSLLDKQWLRVKKRSGQRDTSQTRPGTKAPAKARTPVD
ncbi:ribonuclease P protein component [Sansalvadorimonas sp. 2012CJ34-2]|uniref:Ribonuclease P protein component n=1 Tax=Parendozoicomonas callyspongiae TaxID=2942213 RepID=A0ABT0PB04_9GAMM|nr:ribonuclease P protein component [Sansalvadorimonas sp. 2012CJ34-2]MCL6268560.1 ribonuclease P protein component [Sansalvadorimonas sp. 2012CJ34-2]